MLYIIYRISYSTYTAGLNIAVLSMSNARQEIHIQIVARPLPHWILNFAQPRAGFQKQPSLLPYNVIGLK